MKSRFMLTLAKKYVQLNCGQGGNPHGGQKRDPRTKGPKERSEDKGAQALSQKLETWSLEIMKKERFLSI